MGTNKPKAALTLLKRTGHVLPNRRAARSPVRQCAFACLLVTPSLLSSRTLAIAPWPHARPQAFTCLPARAFMCLPALPDRRAARLPVCAFTCLPVCAFICLRVLPDRRATRSSPSSATSPGRMHASARIYQIAGPHARHSTHLLVSQRAPSFVSWCCQIAGPHARQSAHLRVRLHLSRRAARSPGRMLASVHIYLSPSVGLSVGLQLSAKFCEIGLAARASPGRMLASACIYLSPSMRLSCLPVLPHSRAARSPFRAFNLLVSQRAPGAARSLGRTLAALPDRRAACSPVCAFTLLVGA